MSSFYRAGYPLKLLLRVFDLRYLHQEATSHASVPAAPLSLVKLQASTLAHYLLNFLDSLYFVKVNWITYRVRAYIPLEKFTLDEMARLPKLRSIDIELQVVSAIAQCRN